MSELEAAAAHDQQFLDAIADKLFLHTYGEPGTPHGDKIIVSGRLKIAWLHYEEERGYWLVGLRDGQLRWIDASQLPGVKGAAGG